MDLLRATLISDAMKYERTKTIDVKAAKNQPSFSAESAAIPDADGSVNVRAIIDCLKTP